MESNLTRFEKDIERLRLKAHDLQLAFIMKAYGPAKGKSRLKEADISDDDIAKAADNSSFFNVEYQQWYSESIYVIKQLIPERLKDFRDLYERPHNRKEIDFLSYVISDAIIGLETNRSGKIVADDAAAIPKFQAQMAILLSARQRFKSSLFDIKQTLQAELFDSEIEAARHLLSRGFIRAAGAVAGVVLEKHLRQVCDNHAVSIPKKNPGINDLNQLLRDAGILDIPQWRSVTFLGDIRNLCDHNKQKEPTQQQVADLVDGTDKIVKTLF